jgi:hypothetical protein
MGNVDIMNSRTIVYERTFKRLKVANLAVDGNYDFLGGTTLTA